LLNRQGGLGILPYEFIFSWGDHAEGRGMLDHSRYLLLLTVSFR
jgi:hypothetical protein